jgi:hypothetical protein
MFTFVDDLQPTGPGKRECWEAARRVGSILSWLGLQDASRKRRDSSQTPGAWVGCVVRANADGLFVLSNEAKWNKAPKGLLQEVLDLIAGDPTSLPRKRLKQVRGFLIYVTRTYPCMIPYLIGLHMTIDGWRPNRDLEGWRLSTGDLRLRAAKAAMLVEDMMTPEDEDVPLVVPAVPRLANDMRAIPQLMASDTPVLRRVRCRKSTKAYFGFGDASGVGFGATIQIGDEIWYEYGQWSTETVEEKSSNWREFTNLVEFLEGAVIDHKLAGSEVFIYTDNSTSEAAFWKGSSTSHLLFELVLRLRMLEIDHNILLHVVHIAGKRMIHQGTDELSRADHTAGVVVGRDIHHWAPLNKGGVGKVGGAGRLDGEGHSRT